MFKFARQPPMGHLRRRESANARITTPSSLPKGHRRVEAARGWHARARTRSLVAVPGSMRSQATKVSNLSLSATQESTPPAGAHAVIQALPGAVVQLDLSHRVVDWNPAAERLLGWRAAEVLGRPLPAAAGFSESNVRRMMDRLSADGRLSAVQMRCRRKDQQSLEIEVRVAALYNDDGALTGAVGLLADVTEHQRLARQLAHNAAHDPLTGLPNRTLFLERLKVATAKDATTGVLVIDLDRFKEVNDTLGHSYGDELLAQIGPRLISQALRGVDTVARLGGDEFAVLLPGLTDAGDALAAAARVSSELHRPFVVEGVNLDIEASVGVAVSPDHGTDPATLLQHADTAMYEAKELAAGVVAYRPEHGVGVPSRLAMLGELRRALDEHEFVLYYQPKVDIGTRRLGGVEALIRWQHPTRGLLSPGAFIPIAETTGLITRLTMTVLDLALRQARRWLDDGYRIPVAVNLSARCLHDSRLPERVRAALRRHQVGADVLRLEITESMLMSDPDRALGILTELADSGVRMSIDDYGTGYSSMSYLRELPVDELKIDRSFVLDMADHANAQVLVRTAVDLAHNLGLAAVAEGVEDESTLTALRSLRCDTAQGYHLARPMPAEQLSGWIASNDPQCLTR